MFNFSEKEKNILLCCLKRENDIFWWNNESFDFFEISKEELFQILNRFHFYHLVRFFCQETYITELRVLDDVIFYLFDEGLISKKECDLYLLRHSLGQREA